MTKINLAPPSGTRDFLPQKLLFRRKVLLAAQTVFERHGFLPMDTPAFERLETLTGKYGDEGEKLIFKILKRGDKAASGESDLALRYDLTVPTMRVVAHHRHALPRIFKRYQIGPVWRADRPGKGRYREFLQCDLDTLGSNSAMADAEIICAVHDVLTGLGLRGFRFLLNSRRVLAGLLEAFGVPAELGPGVLITLDKLDKLAPGEVIAELAGRGLAEAQATRLVAALTAADAVEQIRDALKRSDEGAAGLDEVDSLLSLVAGQVPAGAVTFVPRLVRGLSYYTGPIWEVAAEGGAGSLAGGGRYDRLIAALGGPDVPATGGSLGMERILMLLPRPEAGHTRLDVAVTVMDERHAARSFGFAAAARDAGLRASVYLGGSGKLGRQLKWASDAGARWAVIYGNAEEEAGTVTVRDMITGEQTSVPAGDLAAHFAELAAG